MNRTISILMMLAAMLLGAGAAFAENINIYDTGTAPLEIDCSQAASQGGTSIFLFDDGGTGQYEPNRSYTMTLNANNGGYIALYFEEFNLAQGTLMSIRNEVTQELLVSNAGGTTLRGNNYMAINGSITVIWNSGATRGAGFKARVYCGHDCQRFFTDINIDGVTPHTETNPDTHITETFYDVCPGTQLQLHAVNDFFQNGNNGYTQSDANVTYDWAVINSEQDTNRMTGQNPTFTFTESGGYFIICTAKDQQNCYNRNSNKTKVRVSVRPTWTASFSEDSICPGTRITMQGEPHVQQWEWEIPTVFGQEMFIPDGDNSCYRTSLNFDIFEEGATITSMNDFNRIYLNLEHSFLGDLAIMLECPSGQLCMLHHCTRNTPPGWSASGRTVQTPGSVDGSGTHLGLAHDDGSCNNDPGYGFPYYFYPNGTESFGGSGTTVSVNRNDYADSLLCPSQVQYTSILAYGEEHRYGPYESLSSLVGCPLNGTWTMHICDFWGIDNGWIFEWGLYFRDDLYPSNLWQFNNSYTTDGYAWSGVGMQSGMNGSSNAAAIVQNFDDNNWAEVPYTFSATDNFGCTYDTTLIVHVRPAQDAQCCITPIPTASCPDVNMGANPPVPGPCGFTTTLVANEFAYPGNTGEWTYTGPGTATFTNGDQPQTNVTVNVEGDYTFTWHEYYLGNRSCTGEASVNVNFARPYNPTLEAIGSVCRSGNMIILSAPDFGTLTCTAAGNANAGTALNVESRTFTPSLVTVPGTFTITNTIPNEFRCASPRTSSQTFTIYDELRIANRIDTVCSAGANPLVTVSFNVYGVASDNPPVYNVTGYYIENEGTDEANTVDVNVNVPLNATHRDEYSFSALSALEYALVVTDEHGCSNVNVPGYYECACPNYAGTFVDYSPRIMCSGDVYWLERNHIDGHGHMDNENLDAGAYLSFLIVTDPTDITRSCVGTKDANATSIAFSDITNGQYGYQYYLIAVAGYGQGLAAFSATGSQRCRSVSQAVPLMWKETPQPTITGADTCGLVVRLRGSQPPTSMYGYWSASQEGNTSYSYTTIEGTNNNMYNAVVMATHYGQATYTWNVVNAECTGRASAVYNFRAIPRPEAGPDMTVCGVEAVINGAYQSVENSSLQWSGAGVTFSSTSTIQPQVNANAGGTYVITLTERNGGECIGTDNLRITFVNIPAPATTANVDTVCGHVGELQVYNTNPANEGRWTAYDLNNNVLPTVSYSDYNNPNGVNSDRYPHCYVTVPIPDEVTEIEYIFKWTEPINDPRLPDDVSCNGEAIKHMVFRKVPVVSVHQCGSTGNSVTTCTNSVELCAETLASEGYTDFSWVCKEISGRFEDSLSNNTIFTLDSSVHITGYQDVEFYFVGKNSTCMAIDTMHVRFLQRPTANAGLDHVACGNSYELNGVWSLQPSDNYTPTCQWTVGQKPDPDAIVTWANTPHDSIVEGVQVSDYGVYTFIVREINTMGDAASCFDRDTVTVEFMERPNVRAGEDFDVCGLDFQLNAISSHSEGDNISGSWTAMSGGNASFTDRTDPHTTGHFSAYGPATFRWVETNHPSIETDDEETCSAFDEVVVTFYEPPTAVISMNEGDTLVCGLRTPFFLRAEEPGDGISGYWYEVNPSTQFGEDNQTVNSIFTDARVSSYGRHDFYWIEYTGPADNPRFCKDTAGPWTIDFIQNPTADIVPDEQTFCAMEGRVRVNYDGVGVGRWSTSAHSNTITFDDRNDPNTIIRTSQYNSGNPQYPYFEIYWTVQNTEYCTDKDTVKVIFAQVPSDSIKVIPPKCFGEPAIITAYEDTLATYDWDYGNGFLDSVAVNAVNGAFRALVHWEDKQDTHVIGLTTTNSWGCQSNIGRAIVEEPILPEYSYTLFGDTCALGKGAIEFSDTMINFAFFWIDTTAGPTVTDPRGYAITAADNYRVSNLPAGRYTYRSEYQTYNRDFMEIYRQYFGTAQCSDFPVVEVGTVGMLEADIAISADVVGNLVAPEATAIFYNGTNYDNINNKVCEWHYGDGVVERACDSIIQHVYTEPGCYEPYLIVRNRDIPECRDTAYLDDCVFVDKESKLEVPNIFSPNGDGINDFFQVSGQTLKTFHGKILNRYGRVVFEWTDWENEDAGWDGRLNGSTKGTPGVYYYIIEAEGMDGNPYKMEGALHLVK
ncbi:MAG: gliding motility-associated C-terminal domain-containing protein [Bacteroidales bacterium]|nr:gliding motility-associated C-terminal domain-containing protein [Bacteroidales bacterium]